MDTPLHASFPSTLAPRHGANPIFLCRPKVTSPGSAAAADVSSLDDVQRLYVLLEPHAPPGGKARLLVVAKKRLPDTKRHERFYAFVGKPSSPELLDWNCFLQNHLHFGSILQPWLLATIQVLSWFTCPHFTAVDP